MGLRLTYSALLFLIVMSCVDPIKFNVPDVGIQLVVDGSITDQPGPYTVYLSRASTLTRDLDTRVGVARATIIIRSDAGEEETLTELSRGIYQTNHIQGTVGRNYWLSITTEEGAAYESEQEKLNPVGDFNSIVPEFQENDILSNGIELQADRFDILVNATGASTTENYYRWRTTGTYAIGTYPHLKTAVTQGGIRVPAPAPCSGYVVIMGQLVQFGRCTCCDCWVTVNDRLPHVSDDQLIQNGLFRDVNIGAVPVTPRTFYEKYHLYVEQISLNKDAFEFFRLIKAQKDGAASLFQPASGKLRGNIHRLDAGDEVQGFFWAGAVKSRTIFINRRDVPYRVAPIDSIKEECFNVLGAVTAKPPYWQ